MTEFKKEITIVVEGLSSKELSDEELFQKLEIRANSWWENNPCWPYGKPCGKLLDIEIKKVALKN